MTKFLISEGYGAGWSTWNSDYKDCLTSAEIIELVENGASCAEIAAVAEQLWGPGFYAGGAEGLVIHTAAEGSLIQVTEYDGYEEYIVLSGIENYHML